MRLKSDGRGTGWPWWRHRDAAASVTSPEVGRGWAGTYQWQQPTSRLRQVRWNHPAWNSNATEKPALRRVFSKRTEVNWNSSSRTPWPRTRRVTGSTGCIGQFSFHAVWTLPRNTRLQNWSSVQFSSVRQLWTPLYSHHIKGTKLNLSCEQVLANGNVHTARTRVSSSRTVRPSSLCRQPIRTN